MTTREWKRLDVVQRVERGALTAVEASQVLGISTRQLRRLRRQVRRRGTDGVVHGNTGRPPCNRLSDTLRARIVAFARKRYVGFNDQHFTEKLVEQEGLTVSRASVQRILRAAGVGAARRRRPPKHRRRRDRRPQAGLMILWDGSRHDWLEGRGPMLCLMGAIDDATGELLPGAHFVEQECSAGYLRVLEAIARETGLPHSAYMDRHGALKRNDDHWTLEEQLRGAQDLTQVGCALAALDIETIYALSPQAKGRVERLWGTLQDRLTSELRLANARTCAQANAVLERYRPDHNRRFTVAPRETTPAWRPLRGCDLRRICSFCYSATVLNDNTVRLEGMVIDIPPGPRGRSYARARVEVRQYLNRSWGVYFGDAVIATAAASTELNELRPVRHRKRSATAKAFGRAIAQVAASLP